jgi:putative flippase GtrA
VLDVARRDLGWQVASFGLIGLASTAVTVGLYALMRSWWPPLLANLVALVLTNLLNTEANRRLTFAGTGGSTHRIHLQSLLLFALYYALTSVALLTLEAIVAQPTRWQEVAVLLAASLVGTAARFLLLRVWVFPHGPPGQVTHRNRGTRDDEELAA